MHKGFYYFSILISLFIGSCIETQSSGGNSAKEEAAVVNVTQSKSVISLRGEILPEKVLPERIKAKRQRELAVARKNYESNPDSLDYIIWYGRRLAYLGEYYEAIRIYSLGLDKFPTDYHLLRHRGHRYMTIRQFDKAIDDLQKAAFYARPAKNAIEPDGIPNRLNKPLSNDKFNIWYHLGISYYLKGNFDKALSAFRQCMEYSNNDDLLVATTDWFYMTYRKIGNLVSAEELLNPIKRRMNIIENQAYHQRLLMYKGMYEAQALLENANRENDSLEPTLAYGVANWYLVNGKVDLAKQIYNRILRGDSWDSFGYIAAEADWITLDNL